MIKIKGKGNGQLISMFNLIKASFTENLDENSISKFTDQTGLSVKIKGQVFKNTFPTQRPCSELQ